jgi:hypothetical protein
VRQLASLQVRELGDDTRFRNLQRYCRFSSLTALSHDNWGGTTLTETPQAARPPITTSSVPRLKNLCAIAGAGSGWGPRPPYLDDLPARTLGSAAATNDSYRPVRTPEIEFHIGGVRRLQVPTSACNAVALYSIIHVSLRGGQRIAGFHRVLKPAAVLVR